MAETPEEPCGVSALARRLREEAAKEPDPKEAESLLKTAEEIEGVERDLLQGQRELAAMQERIRLLPKEIARAQRREKELPGWVVILVLAGFFAALWYIKIKHYSH